MRDEAPEGRLNVQYATFGARGLSIKIIQKMLVERCVEGWAENKHLQSHRIPLRPRTVHRLGKSRPEFPGVYVL